MNTVASLLRSNGVSSTTPHVVGVEKFTREINPQDMSDEDGVSSTSSSTNSEDEEETAPASSYRGWCDTEHMPLVKFLRFGNGSYAILETDVDDETVWNAEDNQYNQLPHHNGRQLLTESSVMESLWSGSSSSEQNDPIEPLYRIQDPRALEEAIRASRNDTAFVFGRRCTCVRGPGEFYCPLEVDVCRVWEPSTLSSQRIVQCEGSTQDVHGRFLMPIGLFTTMLFLFCLCMTRRGRYAVTYLARLTLCYDEEQYQQALQNEVDVQLRLAQIRAAQTMEPVLERRTVKAVLKTQSYRPDCGMQQDCMICLADFEPGERVGKLPCHHTFHVDCLKEWLKRKNHCPLCHAENLALPCTTGTSENTNV